MSIRRLRNWGKPHQHRQKLKGDGYITANKDDGLISQHEPPLNNTVSVETPEGITLDLQPAGCVVRSMAYGIDLCCKAMIMVALLVGTKPLGHFGFGLFFLGYFLVSWFYSILFEQGMNGQSPGKKLFRLRVVNQDGTSVNWAGSLNRNLFRIVDAMPAFYMFGFISMIVNSEFKRLGDMVAHTMVVYIPEYPLSKYPSGQPEAPTIQLSFSQQQAVMNFAERYDQLTSSSRAELAALIFGPSRDSHAQTIINWAYYLRGVADITQANHQARKHHESVTV